MLLLSSKLIKDLCWDNENSRFVPRRSFKWLEKHHHEVYLSIKNQFHEYPKSPREVYILLSSGINSYDDIPMCSVCNESKVIIVGNSVSDICSNRCSVKSDKAQAKTAKTCFDRYGAYRKWGSNSSYELGQHYLQQGYKNLDDLENPEIMKDLQRKSWIEVANHFGLTTNSHSSAHKFMIRAGYPIFHNNGTSQLEADVYKFVRANYAPPVERNIKSVINPYEIDIYVPGIKFGIEFNGLYWHSVGSKDQESSEAKLQHYNKTKMCLDLGIQLFQIFENEWTNKIKRSIWKSKIISALSGTSKIDLSICDLDKIPIQQFNEFMSLNHLYGPRDDVYIGYQVLYKSKIVGVVGATKDDELVVCPLKGYSINPLNDYRFGGLKYLLDLRWEIPYPEHPSNEIIECYYTKDGNLYSVNDMPLDSLESCYDFGFRKLWDSGKLEYIIGEQNEN